MKRQIKKSALGKWRTPKLSTVEIRVFEDYQPCGVHKVVLSGINYVDKQPYKICGI